jgi:hypothetical protein
MNRDDVIRMARGAGGDDWGIFRDFMPEIERFANLVAAAEREACAALADKWHDYCAWEGRVVGLNIAKDIRARGSDETPRSS